MSQQLPTSINSRLEYFLVFQKEPVKLKRTVGVLSASAVVFGTCIGAGIFISPKGKTWKLL